MIKKIMVVLGTRPEAIKLASLIAALKARPDTFETIVCSSGQHREMLLQALETFGIEPEISLDVMKPNQGLPELTASLVHTLSETIARFRPDRVIVQGDTTTAFAGALAAFYQHVPVAHVEAGLRSHDRQNPFPEEVNRRLVTAIADIHFAPTQRAAEALKAENVSPKTVHVTGNTVVDALKMLQGRLVAGIEPISPKIRELGADARPLILVTCHRRENFGPDLLAICRALDRLARRHPNHHLVFPVHLNPVVRAEVMPLLDKTANISLLDPITYPDLVYLLSRAVLVLSDSGGIQEEAPSFGIPVLVLRRTTERSEGIDAGVAELVGADEELIIQRATDLLSSTGRNRVLGPNPYGDGRASERIIAVLAET
jgi:UDP-N-acetylglucosamine 2-epimerase (non-hydrolysing)